MKVYGYARYATRDSNRQQENDIERYCKRTGLSLLQVFRDTCSGRGLLCQRAHGRKLLLLADINSAIVVTSACRLSRSLSDLASCIDGMLHRGCEVHLVGPPSHVFRPRDSNTDLVMLALSNAAAFERAIGMHNDKE